MAVDTAHLAPDGAQVSGPGRDLDIHDVLHRLAVAHAVHEAADAADAFRHVYIFGKLFLFNQLFQTSVDEADGGNRFHHLFILQNQIQMDRLRQHRMLRPERDNTSCRHYFPSCLSDCCAAAFSGCEAAGSFL